MHTYVDIIFPGYMNSKDKTGQTATDRNSEEGTGYISISTYESGNHKSEDCDKKILEYLDELAENFPNFNKYDYTELCKKCDEFYVYINNLKHDLKECDIEKSIFFDIYQGEIRKLSDNCARELKNRCSALPHFKKTEELTSETGKPSKESKDPIESKKEVILYSESGHETSETKELQTGSTQDEISNKVLRATEHEQKDVLLSQHVVKPTSDSTENEGNVPEQMETAVQPLCVSDHILKRELRDTNCCPEKLSTQLHDSCEKGHVNRLDTNPHLSNLTDLLSNIGSVDKIQDHTDSTISTEVSDHVIVRHEKSLSPELGDNDSTQRNTYQGNTNEVETRSVDTEYVSSTMSHGDRTNIGRIYSDSATSSDVCTRPVSLDNDTTRDAIARSDGVHAVDVKSVDVAIKYSNGEGNDKKYINAKSDDIKNVDEAAGNEDTDNKCINPSCPHEGVPHEQQNSHGSSISYSTHLISYSSGKKTVEGINILSGNNVTLNNGVTGEGILLDGSGNNEQGITYKNYIIIILVPLAIILLMTLLVKFTPLGMFLTKKKRKKRKNMNEKLQKVLLKPEHTSETRVHLAYSYL